MLALVALSHGAIAGEVPPPDVELALEEVVKREVNRVFKTKNDLGVKNHRATHSNKFLATTDGAWQVVFTEDIANAEQMRSERYLLTLAQGAGGKWEIRDRTLEMTYEKLVRDVPGNEKFYRFTRLDIAHEGFEIHAANGTMIVDYLLGVPDSIRLHSDTLAYSYEIPADVKGHQRQILPHLRRANKDAFALTPETASISCDATSCAELLATSFLNLEEIEVVALSGPLAKDYAEQTSRTEKRRVEFPFSGFRLPRDPENRFLGLGVRDKGGDHFVGLTSYNQWAREVHFSVSGYGTLFAYPAKESRKNA